MSLIAKLREQLVDAFRQRIDSIDSLQELEQVVQNVGLSTSETSRHASNGIGPKSYWRRIRKLAKEKGISRAEARELYNSNKTTTETKTKRPTSNMKKAQAKYWREIRKIAKENGITNSEARTIYGKQKV